VHPRDVQAASVSISPHISRGYAAQQNSQPVKLQTAIN
jgi:hypothetical protein